AIEKLLKEKKAKKIGLHFSNNAKYSNQHSTLLIKVADDHFHIPPAKEDVQTLKHLAHLDENFRNPQTRKSVSYAIKIVYSDIDWNVNEKKYKLDRRSIASYYTPSSLGKMEWPPTKKFHNPS